MTYWVLGQGMMSLDPGLKEERSKSSQQEEDMVERQETLKFLEEVMKLPLHKELSQTCQEA